MFQATRKHRHRSASRVSDIATNRRRRAKRFGLESLEARLVMTGTWTPLVNLAPVDTIGSMQLLSDGSVLQQKPLGSGYMAQKLSPDATGSYVNGTWSALAPMTHQRGGGTSNTTLPDGREFVLGGIKSPDTGEIYNPLTNAWSDIAPCPESFQSRPHYAVDQWQNISRLEHGTTNVAV